MSQALLTRLGLAAALLAATAMTGCAHAPKPLYAWGDYQGKVYEHLKGQGNGPEQQILDLEKDLELAASEGATPPPGLYAHLGLLYLSVGKADQAVQFWGKEKSLFPESTRFVDYLLGNMKKQGS
jgi:hypothetical protein